MPPNARSRGYATLSVVSILALIFSALALSSARHVIADSNAMRNTVLARRALAAADGGLAHGLAWLGAIDGTTGMRGSSLLAGSWSATCDPATDPRSATNTRTLTTQIDGHAVEIGFTRQCVPGHDFGDDSSNGKQHEIIEITARASGESQSSATVRQKVFLPRVVNPDFSGAPLVINGCIGDASGKFYVTAPATRPAIATSKSVDSAGRLTGTAQPCIDTSQLKEYDAATSSELPTVGVMPVAFDGSDPESIWKHVFGLSRAQIKTAAGNNLGSIRYYDQTRQPPDPWHESLGSAAQPAIIVFDQGLCPKINGTIRGIIYYRDSSTCGSNVLNALTLYGSIVSETGIGRMTGNPVIHQQDYASTNPSFPVAVDAIRVAGTWRDF